MQESKSHHYSPEFYLRQWCTEGKLVAYSRPNIKLCERTISVKGVGYQDHLYSLPHLSAPARTILEDRLLKIVDQRGHDALRAILGNCQDELSDENKVGWAQFVLSLHYRHPDRVSFLRTSWTHGYKERLNELRQANPTNHSLEFTDIDNDHVFGLLFAKVTSSSAVLDYLISMKWFLFEVLDDCASLLTGDHPLIRTPDLRLAKSFIALPVSPRKVFLAVNSDEYANRIKATPSKQVVADMNDVVCRNARRFVFSRDKRQQRFIDSRLKQSAKLNHPGQNGVR